MKSANNNMPAPLPLETVRGDFWLMLATWFGSGLIRPAPGTMGTLAAVPFGYALFYFSGTWGLAAGAVSLLLVGTVAADRYGRKTKVTDDQSIVVDEVVGFWIAALPAAGDLRLWLAAFLLFRFFDIVKVWPASFFDRRGKNGFDVMMDDVVAGIYAAFGVAIGAVLLIP